MGVVVAFSYAAWVARYPEFSAVSEATATAYFAEACIYHRNDITGVVNDATIQSALLNMVTAHIAARYSQSQGSPNPGAAQDANSPVGRINSASEGSVSVQTEYASETPGSMAWFAQSKYGADYWAATKAYRSMRYRASPTVVVNGAYPSRPYGSGFWPF